MNAIEHGNQGRAEHSGRDRGRHDRGGELVVRIRDVG